MGKKEDLKRSAQKAIQPLVEARTKADQEWRAKEANRIASEAYQGYRITYSAACEVLAPILVENSATLGIVPPTDPIVLVHEPMIYADRNAMFYCMRVGKRTDSPVMNGSHLKYLANQQIRAYAEFRGEYLPLAYYNLLRNLVIVSVRDIGYAYILHVGRMDDPATIEYIQAQQLYKRHPGDRNMI